MNRFLLLAAGTLAASFCFAQNLYSNQSSNVNQVALFSTATSISGVAAPAGAFFSELQTDSVALPNTVFNTNAGYSTQATGAAGAGFRLADDFTVTGPGWNVTGFKVYAYAAAVAPGWLTGGNFRLWSGRPGDLGANILLDTGALTGAQIGQSTTITTNAGTGQHFRIFNSSPGSSTPGTSRLITEFTFNANISLGAGTYWIDYQLERLVGQAFSTVFAPSTTHQGVRGLVGANARQFSGGLWGDAFDPGLLPVAPNNLGSLSNVTQEMPFLVTGTPVPEPMTLTALGLAALAARRKRRNKK